MAIRHRDRGLKVGAMLQRSLEDLRGFGTAPDNQAEFLEGLGESDLSPRLVQAITSEAFLVTGIDPNL